MRKLILSMQVSLDGFIEGPSGDISWIEKDDNEQWKDLFEMLQTVDLFLLGRKMFPDYRDFWQKALINPQASPYEVAYAKLAEKTKHIVFSHTITDPQWANTQIINGDVAAEITKIKMQPGKDIQVVGGAQLAATVIEAGLADEYRLNIAPVILGAGKSFFRLQKAGYSLDLISAKQLASGVIIARYKSIKSL
ncbi:MAG: dihydrofolate reductase family protein [Ferruginibacter sp.]